MGDANQLEQVFLNLINNAKDTVYGKENAFIKIQTFTDQNGTSQEQVCIRFIDNGQGIPPSHRSKLFDPFFTTKEIGKGTGLGLSISYGIIKDHKGHIIDYQGDGLFAAFEEGSADEHALSAVRAGKQMLEALDDFNEYMCQFLERQQFQIRIGVHTGPVIVGSIGIDEMRKETVIGDAVNYASRVETANKELATQFLISESTFKALSGRVETRRSFVIEVKGKEGQHTVYEVA